MHTIIPADIVTLLAQFAQEYPGFRLVKKHSASERCTTIGTTVYVPLDWAHVSPTMQYVRLRHEEAHLHQFRQLGTLPFLVGYALWPLPIGLAHQRYLLEREAFAAEMRAVLETAGPDALTAKRAYYVHQFIGAPYYYAYRFAPWAVEQWVDHTINALLVE